jgi:hypothetical protein
MTKRSNVSSKIKIALFLISFIMINSCTNSQTEENSAVGKNYKSPIPSNDSVQFSVVLASCDTCIPIRTRGLRVSLNELPPNISTIPNDEWLELLRNDSTNFSASVHLYFLHDKDAFLLSKYGTPKLWNENLKVRDLEFWIKYLSEN